MPHTQAPSSPARRQALRGTAQWLVLVSTAPLLASLGGCGFQLRRPPELQLKRVHLTGLDAYSTMGEALRRQLSTSPGAELVDTVAAADVVLEVLEDTRDKTLAASTATGQVRELTLEARLRFRVRSPAGLELIAPTELSLSRDMSYTETAALSKEQEADLLFSAMQADLAAQVLRRLSALKRSGPDATAR